jgi:hypothetical protein
MNRDRSGLPAPRNSKAILLHGYGPAPVRTYTVRSINHLDNPIHYQGSVLGQALRTLVEIEGKGWRGEMIETVSYQALTRAEDWVGHKHACGCVELPAPGRSDRDEYAEDLILRLAIDSTDHGPGFARTCDHGRELWRAAATAMPGIGDVTAEVWSAAHDVHFAAWYAHLDPRGEA